MKHTLKIIVLLSVLFLPKSRAGQKSIVFDLDGVVLFHANNESNLEKTIEVKTDLQSGGDTAARVNRYRVSDGFPELVQWLIQNGWKVHFFSFGNETRNRSALSQICMPNGESVLSAVEKAGGKVFSNKDGLNLDPNDTRTEIDTSLPKSQRPKIVKSLAKVLGAEAEDAYLVEDIMTNTAPTEREGHVIYIPYKWAVSASGKQVKFLESNQETLDAATEKNLPALARISETRFSRLRDRMFYLAGLVEEVTRREKVTGTPVSESLEKMQWRRDSEGNYMTVNGDRLFKMELMDSPLSLRGKELLSDIPVTRKAQVTKVSPSCLNAFAKI